MHIATTTPTLAQPHTVERLVVGQATRDGAGVKLTRVLTHNLQHRLAPFLMFDAFGTDNPGHYIGGFPDPAHRGFETVTYRLEGRMRHRDSAGREGLLSSSGVQWMTAGRSRGVASAMQRGATQPLYPDLQLPLGVAFEQALENFHASRLA